MVDLAVIEGLYSVVKCFNNKRDETLFLVYLVGSLVLLLLGKLRNQRQESGKVVVNFPIVKDRLQSHKREIFGSFFLKTAEKR